MAILNSPTLTTLAETASLDLAAKWPRILAQASDSFCHSLSCWKCLNTGCLILTLQTSTLSRLLPNSVGSLGADVDQAITPERTQSSVVQWMRPQLRELLAVGRSIHRAADQGPQEIHPPGPRGSRQCFGRPAEGSPASGGLWSGARLRAQAHGSPQDWMAPVSPGRKLPREPNRPGRGLEAGGAVGAGWAGQVQVRRAVGAGWDTGEGRGAAAQERAGRLGPAMVSRGRCRWCPLESGLWPQPPQGGLWGGIRAGPGQSEVRGR